jgi:acetylornithine deacetylase/succinyl-diaminopimelate desuccinylase-like protein
VPEQDHHEIEQLMIDHLQRIAPPTVRIEVKVIQGGQPIITPLDHPAIRLGSRALEKAFGKAPLFHRSGGSIPVVAAMQSVLGLPSVMIGFASPNGNFHAPNEWMPLANYRGGMDAIVRLWQELGSVSAAELRGV